MLSGAARRVYGTGALLCLPALVAPGAGPSACRNCHPQIYRTYLATGMGKSFSRIGAADGLENWDRNNAFYHERSDRYYSAFRRDGKYFVRRHQVGYKGKETNFVEREIHYAVGSGNHARSYIHRTPDGRLIELPVSWYAEKDGHWAMSPGYDRPDHPDFRREVSEECLFCHNGYPSGRGDLAEGIDCQRCHGPGGAHVEQPAAGSILNPARFNPRQQLEACLQCHLESTSRPLPHAIRRYGRPAFSYWPGEPLEDYKIHFDHAPGSGPEDKFEVNHAGYRFLQSKCYSASRGKLTCTTCHDPHHARRGEEAERHYTQVCRSCHPAAHPGSALEGCTSCHMPARRAEDAVHVVMRDHRIPRRVPAGDPLAPLDEWLLAKQRAYYGKVAPYYPRDLAGSDRLYLAIAQVKETANLREGIALLEKIPAALRPAQGEFYFDVAEAYRKTGAYGKARPFYEEAIRRSPGLAKAYAALGESLLRSRQFGDAVSVLERGLERKPNDPEILNTLGVAYGQRQRVEDSVRALRRAVEQNPDLPLAWLNLGVSFEQLQDWSAAENSYRNAIRSQPDFARAHEHLANLLSSLGDASQAEHYYGAARRLAAAAGSPGR